VTTPLTFQTINMNAEVYRLANPTLNTPSIALAARVGDASPSAGVSITNTSPDIYTEGLKVSINTASAGFTASGAIANLSAGGTDASTLRVGLNTGTAGSFAGTAALTLASTGAGTTGAPDLGLPGQNVNLSGKVYTPAVTQVANTTVNFGIVHVGDAVGAKALTVTNAAPVTPLNDVLRGSLGPASGPFTTGGNLGAGLGPGASDSTRLTAALNTASAGVFSSSAILSSQSHNADMTDLALTTSIALSAQVNNYANPVFNKTSGDGIFGRSGLNFTLDFGNVLLNSGIESALLAVLNDVAAPADLLDGSFTFDFGTTQDFLLSGYNPFKDIAAGGSFGGLSVELDTSNLGNFTDSIILHSLGHNASGFRGELPTISLVLHGNVIEGGGEVPEPATWLLILSGLGPLAAARRYLFKKK